MFNRNSTFATKLTPAFVYYTIIAFLSENPKVYESIYTIFEKGTGQGDITIEQARVYKVKDKLKDRYLILYYPGLDKEDEDSRSLINIYNEVENDLKQTQIIPPDSAIQRLFVVAEVNNFLIWQERRHFVAASSYENQLLVKDSVYWLGYSVENYFKKIIPDAIKEIYTGSQLDTWTCGHHAIEAIIGWIKNPSAVEKITLTSEMIANHYALYTRNKVKLDATPPEFNIQAIREKEILAAQEKSLQKSQAIAELLDEFNIEPITTNQDILSGADLISILDNLIGKLEKDSQSRWLPTLSFCTAPPYVAAYRLLKQMVQDNQLNKTLEEIFADWHTKLKNQFKVSIAVLEMLNIKVGNEIKLLDPNANFFSLRKDEKEVTFRMAINQ